MDSFLLTLLLVFAIALGGRDQLLVAQLSDSLAKGDQRPVPLLALGLSCAAISAAALAVAGWSLAEILPARAADMLVAFALAAAAIELAWPIRLKPVKEPTRSLGAIGIVLLARQIGDGARFVIFALAAEATYPLVTIIGGAIGGGAAITLGWFVGKSQIEKFPLYYLRLGFAVFLILAALLIGLNARYVIF